MTLIHIICIFAKTHISTHSIMRTLVLLILLFGNIALSKAATEPIPPPYEERRCLGYLALDCLNKGIEWKESALGFYTWIIATTPFKYGFKARINCHNNLKNGQETSRVVFVPPCSFSNVLSGDLEKGHIEEYRNYDYEITTWHFTIKYKNPEDIQEDNLAAIFFYDDFIPPLETARQAINSNTHNRQ